MKFLALAAVLLAAVSPSTFVWTSSTVKTIAPGVTLTQDIQGSPALLVDVLSVAPDSGAVVAPAVANDSLTDNTGDIRKGRESVASLALRDKLLAAVNGDFFPFTGDPLGLGVMDGEIYSEPFVGAEAPGRAAIGWPATGSAFVGIPQLDATLTTDDGTDFKITGIDRLTSQTDSNDLVLTTSRFGPTSASRGNGTEIVVSNAVPMPIGPGTTSTGTVTAVVTGDPQPVNVPAGGFVLSAPAGGALASKLAASFHVGDQAKVSIHIRDITPPTVGAPSGSWDNVREAIGGGPILLDNGRVIVDGASEGLSSAFTDTAHARTAVGVRADGTVLIVTVDDSSALSTGLTIPQLAQLMQSLGAVNAINLDGGGSTTMVAAGVTVDYPSGSSYERPVADMLTVRAPTDPEAGQEGDPSPASAAQIVLPTAPIVAGGAVALSVEEGGLLLTAVGHRIVWNGPVGDIGFITQDGILHALRAGSGTVSASVDGRIVSTPITILAAAPAVPAAPTAPPTAPAAPASSGASTPPPNASVAQ